MRAAACAADVNTLRLKRAGRHDTTYRGMVRRLTRGMVRRSTRFKTNANMRFRECNASWHL